MRGGQRIALSARGSSDPDGDSLQYLWFHYPEASGGTTPLMLDSAENMDTVMFKAPMVSAPQDAWFIVQVTDRGTPALTRYRRVRVTILP